MENKKKKHKYLTRLLFSRAFIFMILAGIQFAIMFLIATLTYNHEVVVYGVYVILTAVTIIHILNEQSNSSFKMVWIIPVLVIPVFGACLYIYVNLQAETKRQHKRLTSIEKQLKPHLKQNLEVFEELSDKSAGEKGLARYLYNTNDFPVFSDCEVKYYSLGEDNFKDMIKYLKNAKKFIFFEYFIVNEGYMWDTILEILKQKVKEGVEVRFMYDGMCSIVNLPYGYYHQLEKMGIKSVAFSPIKPVFSTYQNNRDHRKILVIDGEVAFTGGVNLADEYINKIVRFGHWKDTAIMVKGDAVKTFTMMFLKMWYVARKQYEIPQEDINKFVYESICESVDKGFVIPYADDPYGDERVAKQVYIDILNRAREYVYIMTPYLILDDEVIYALRYCAKRGVKTVIIMPHIPDKKYAYYLARSYYKQLIGYGVKIYEYTPGFVHAKVFVSDGIRASVGTSNLDFRSLYLHFECGMYVYNNEEIKCIEKDVENTLEKCQLITEKNCDEFSKGSIFLGKMLRLVAPLM